MNGLGTVAASPRHWRELLHRLGPVLVLLSLIGAFALLQGSSFLNPLNMKLILVHSVILITCALGMTAVLISGGLDLSVGSSLALAAVSGALVYRATGSPTLAMGACILASSCLGLVNGALIAGLGLSPFIVTLGTLGVGRGAARMLADDSRLSLQHPDAGLWRFDILSQRPLSEPWASLGVPAGVAVAAVVLMAMLILMHQTVFGRRIYAIGANREAARLCGVPIAGVTCLVYVLAGILFGLAGMMQLGYDNAGNSTAREGFELDVIAAVVIGGASLSGGSGSLWGSVIGALIMVVLRNGFGVSGVSASMQMLVIGAIIVVAVAVDQARQGKLQLPFRRRAG